jgi:hypothetical protein
MHSYLIVPFLVQVIYQAILVVVSGSAAAAVLAERNATVAPAGGHEARTGGCEDNKHVLVNVSPRLVPGVRKLVEWGL